jgi:2-dehydropantoate 2-reductase
VVGVGRIGSTFAYQLARAGHDVTVVARPGSPRLQQLLRDNAIVLHNGERAEVAVADQLDERIAYDLVIVTVLAHQVDALLPVLNRSKAQCIQFMFVTFEPDRLRQSVGPHRCTFGMPAVRATLDPAGRLHPTIARSRTLHGDARWVDLFQEAGMPSALEQRMPLWLRSHVPLAAAMESACVAGQQRGRGASWAAARTCARGLRAGFEIVRGLGDKPYPRAKAMISRAPRLQLTFLLWSISRSAGLRDLLADSVTEARALADVMAYAAAQQPGLAAAGTAVLAMKATAAVNRTELDPNSVS